MANYELTIDELKKLIGDLTIEAFALRRDNIRMAETLQKIQEHEANSGKVPHRVIDLDRERESNG
jgi:hypothetical protein